MKIAVVGAGPAGLAFAYLTKRADPRHDITIWEKGPADRAEGWGIVYPPGALDFLPPGSDPSLYAIRHFDVVAGDAHIPFPCRPLRSIDRLVLLRVLQAQCRAAGVTLYFDSTASLPDPAAFDLVVGADGAHSAVRAAHADALGTTRREGGNPYVWMGTRQMFHMLTLIFRRHRAGMFIAHAYKYLPDASTFIVECDAATWRAARLDALSMAEAADFLSGVFAEELAGHPLRFQDGSRWQRFGVVHNRVAAHGNVALLGDALQTGHFSIGSGTAFALTAASALATSLGAGGSLAEALARFVREVAPPLAWFQTAANASMQWFENAHRLAHLAPEDLARSFAQRIPG